MTQPQLSVRDKIWNMFCKEFWIITGNSTPELERNRRKFIDQIITLAQDEDVKKIKTLREKFHDDTNCFYAIDEIVDNLSKEEKSKL